MPVARKLIILVPLAYTVTVLVAVVGIVLWAVAQAFENLTVTVFYAGERGE